MAWINASEKTPEKHGFVYMIREKNTGMSYVGIKRFWKKKTLQPLKGRKNKRHSLVESDWRTYNTSSKLMQDKILKKPSNYFKEIICYCDSQTELKCREAGFQLEYYMRGDWDMLYNEVINLRVRIRKNNG